MCLDVYIFVRHTYASPIRLATPFRHPPFAPNSNATSKRFSSVHLVEFLSLQTMQASHTRLADIQTPIECTSPSQHIYIYICDGHINIRICVVLGARYVCCHAELSSTVSLAHFFVWNTRRTLSRKTMPTTILTLYSISPIHPTHPQPKHRSRKIVTTIFNRWNPLTHSHIPNIEAYAP